MAGRHVRALASKDVNVEMVLDMCTLLNHTHSFHRRVHLNLHPDSVCVHRPSRSIMFCDGKHAAYGSIVPERPPVHNNNFLFQHPLLRDKCANVRAVAAMDYYGLLATLYGTKFHTVPFYIHESHADSLRPFVGDFLARYLYARTVINDK